MLTITEDAAKKIRSIIDEENADLKLRIFVQGGGCSGFQYGFSLEELPPAEDDLTFEKNGIEIETVIEEQGKILNLINEINNNIINNIK